MVPRPSQHHLQITSRKTQRQGRSQITHLHSPLGSALSTRLPPARTDTIRVASPTSAVSRGRTATSYSRRWTLALVSPRVWHVLGAKQMSIPPRSATLVQEKTIS